jgi:HEAT repeat protein
VKRTAAILAGVVLLAGVWICIVATHRPRSLTFQDKTVSAWAFQLYGPIDREKAAQAFQQLGEQAVPDLVRMLRTKDPFLAKVLHPPPPWLPVRVRMLLLRGFHPADASARRLVAANALGALGPKAAPAAPALGAMLTGRNVDERWEAARALGRMGTTNAVEICITVLRGNHPNLHHPAIYALGEMGTNAALALPELLACLRHDQEVVRTSASHTLSRIGMPALDPLVEKVRSARGVERRAAAQALTRLMPTPRVAVPPLLEMVSDAEPLSRLQAAEALAGIAPWKPEVMAALTNLLSDADASVRTAAADALAKTAAQFSTHEPR